jgi:hypothetical protein
MSDLEPTERIGQLTGSSRTVGELSLTTDWTNRPLLNETSRFGVNGIDLGANTEHNGRLYIFFGDVAIDGNPDAVCWTTDTDVQRKGGHLAIGWDFRIPNDHQGATAHTGQWEWRLCSKCHGLFFCPDRTPAGVCPAGGVHDPIGWIFVLPNDHQFATDATGQRDWRPCDKCSGLFFAAGGDPSKTACPAGGQHRVPPGSWIFFLPALQTGASGQVGQPEWRFCANCHGLFWNGDSIKGICPGALDLGGGFRLNPVLDSPGQFAPFTVDPPIGLLGPNETPTGAFSHAGRAYVFVWVGPRPGQGPHPQPGSYLTSKADPSAPGTYRLEQLISPLDFSRTSFSQVAAVRVDNAGFPGVFPEASGAGLVMFGGGHNVILGDDAIHLAWSPLAANTEIAPLSMVYYTGDPAQPWSPEPNTAVPLVPRHGYTSVSAAWLPDPGQWALVYGTANPVDKGGPVDGPVMARFGRTLFELARAPDIDIFNPAREHAYGSYMHQPGLDQINPDVPPAQPPGQDDPGWAYGAHVLPRFIQQTPHGLELYYLLSTASPYQVHLMHTTLRSL